MTTSPHFDGQIPTGSVHDFDFLVGHWDVASRRLRARHVAGRDWDEFPGRVALVQRLGGVVNVAPIDFPAQGFSGLTLRTFDLDRRLWSIYWVNSGRGVLEPPVIGGFVGDRGLF